MSPPRRLVRIPALAGPLAEGQGRTQKQMAAGRADEAAMDPDKRLSFPTRMLKVQGGMVEEYIIPDDRKEEVLRQLVGVEDK